jgi:cytochrome P450
MTDPVPAPRPPRPVAAVPAPRRPRPVDQVRTAVAFARSPHRALLDIHRRFGPVCLLGQSAFLLGPEANQFVLGHSELFRWREAFDSLVVVDGETALIVSDGADHQRRRRLVTPAFSRRQIEVYSATMRTEIDAAIDGWRPGQVIDLYQELRRVIRRATIAVLFGPRLAWDEPELGRLLQLALAPVERLPPWQQLQRLGAPFWRRAVAARAEVARRVAEEIAYRRAAGPSDPGVERPDVLSLLVDSRDDDGSGLTDLEITDQVISLIAAGYETTSAAMAWAVWALLSDRSVWSRAAESTTAQNIPAGGSWRYLDGVVSETLRLYPPAAISARTVATPFSFAGTEVPAGRTVIFSPYVTHRLPELWPEPLRFRPERWDPAGPGCRRPAPHEFLPFGGGTHRCLGAAFASTELTVLLEQLLRRTTLELGAFDPKPVGLAAMRPRRGPFARVLAIS